MRIFVGGILLLLIGAASGAWFTNSKMTSSAYKIRSEELIKMQQMEASLRSKERDLLSCKAGAGVLAPSVGEYNVQKKNSPKSTVSVNSTSDHLNNADISSAESLRLDYLDQKIEDAPQDLAWMGAMSTSISSVLSEWPGAKQTGISCSQYICRIEIVSGRGDQAEKIIDGLNNMVDIKGERMIQFDDENRNAVVYIGRDGNTSLLTGDGF